MFNDPVRKLDEGREKLIEGKGVNLLSHNIVNIVKTKDSMKEATEFERNE